MDFDICCGKEICSERRESDSASICHSRLRSGRSSSGGSIERVFRTECAKNNSAVGESTLPCSQKNHSNLRFLQGLLPRFAPGAINPSAKIPRNQTLYWPSHSLVQTLPSAGLPRLRAINNCRSQTGGAGCRSQSDSGGTQHVCSTSPAHPCTRPRCAARRHAITGAQPRDSHHISISKPAPQPPSTARFARDSLHKTPPKPVRSQRAHAPFGSQRSPFQHVSHHICAR